jgi:hypothetical protein
LPVFVLPKTGGSIEKPTAFSSIADEFGHALEKDRHPLRELNNEATINPNDKINKVDRYEPHDLSKVLSGALYKVMVKIYKKQWRKKTAGKMSRKFKSAFPALSNASK